jgi:hypothetical protein
VNSRRTSRAGASVGAAGGEGLGVAVGNGVAVGVGGVVGTAVAVGVGVTPEAAGVSIVMTGAVAVGSAALLGGEVAVGGALGVAVGWMVIIRGVGVAVAAAVGNARGVSVACMDRSAPRVCPPEDVALSAMGAPTARPARTTATMIPVTRIFRRLADVTAPATALQSWRPGRGSTNSLFSPWSRLGSRSGSGEDLELRRAAG